ncbi:MAG: hypothetical protein VXZ49_02350 [Planctomycetota bacterium]|nr:hypothetical protein [Planctomycetota bacterium]
MAIISSRVAQAASNSHVPWLSLISILSPEEYATAAEIQESMADTPRSI